MLKAYVSSTFKDLQEYRRVAVNTLGQLGFEVRAMETYCATDERPLDLCLADVATCDIYVGIFAWRYGFIPSERNPELRSITECEFRKAVQLGIPCLIFLSNDDLTKWIIDNPDDQHKIERLRLDLKDGRTVRHFDTPDGLGLEISAAVTRWKEHPDFSRYLKGLAAEFRELPDLPNHTKNLALSDIVRITVSFPPKSQKQDATPEAMHRIVDLPQAVAEERAWVLVGEGGQGKSTALRFLAFHFAERWLEEWGHRRLDNVQPSTAPIPIYFALYRHRTNLREQVRNALQRSDFRCSADLAETWLRDRPFLFLIDRLDETEPLGVLDELIDLLRFASHGRLVLASRPMPFLDKWPWPQARLQPFSDVAIRSFFKRLLGVKRGTDLSNALTQHRLLDAFRRPLFARLLALGSPELMDQHRFSPAEIFCDVLEKRFLASWEQAAPSNTEAELVREIQAYLAHDMVLTGRYTVSRGAALKPALELAVRRRVQADVRFIEELIGRILKHGLMEERNGDLQFWHTSFRDYFAAVWLERNATPAQIYFRSWNPNWHESLIFYFGLLRGARLGERLRQLLIGVRVMVALRDIHPTSIGGWLFLVIGSLMNPNVSKGAAGRFFLVLRTLVQAGSEYASLHRKFIETLPQNLNGFLLSSVPSPVAYGPFIKGDWDTHAHYCDLIGQLQIPEAYDYLGRVEIHFSVIAPGLMHSTSEDVVERVIRYLAADDSDENGRVAPRRNRLDRVIVSHLLLQSPDSRYLQRIREILGSDQTALKVRVLKSLMSALSMYQESDDPDSRKDVEEQWTPILINLALFDDDQDVRGTAVSILGKVKNETSTAWLPAQAHQAFLRALNDPNAPVRERALAVVLRCPALEKHVNVAWRLLDDPELSIVFQALSHFRWAASPKRFCRAVLKVLKHHATEGSVLKNVATVLAVHLRAGHLDPHVPRRCFALLMAATVVGPYQGFQLSAVRALGEIRIPWTGPLLAELFHRYEWVEIRCAALDALVTVLGNQAQQYVLEALDDKECEVRERAISACFGDRFDSDFRPLASPKLFCLLNDPSEMVRSHAERTLKKYGYLSEGSSQHQKGGKASVLDNG